MPRRKGRDTLVDVRRLVPLPIRKALLEGRARVRNAATRHLGRRPRLDSRLEVEIYGEPARDVFFGYFDISPFSADDNLVLAHRTFSQHARPEKDDVEIGYYSRTDGRFTSLGQTGLWCWQMGSRLRWLNARTVAYNAMVDGQYGAHILDIDNGAVRAIAAPLYDISPDGRQALSLDFGRLQRLRPGYGYERLSDLTEGRSAPEDSGLSLIDMESGQVRMVLSVADIAAIQPQPDMAGAQHYLNHLTFSPSGNLFCVFHIWQDSRGKRSNRVLLFDRDGNLKGAIRNQRHISHMAWKTDYDILAFAALPGDVRPTYQWIDLRNETWTPVLGGKIEDDGHPSLMPGNQAMFISDSYPDRSSYRSLYLANITSEVTTPIGAFHSPVGLSGPERCDLHPRWSRHGRHIAVDSAHLGRRSLCILDMGELV